MSDAILRRIRPEQFREVILLIVTVGLLLFFATQIPDYFNARSINRLTTGLAITLVVAVGQVLVVLTRNIDLSVSSIVGLSAYVVGTLLTRSDTISPILAVLLAMLLGLVLGAINGVIVAYGGVPAVITTLGTLALYRVVLVEFSGAKTVTTADLPDWLNDIPSANVFSIRGYDLRVMVGVALLAVILGQLTLRFLPFGRRLYAIGSNPDAARTAGLPAKRDVFAAFAICGALSGLAGFMFLVRFGNITVTAAQGLELQVVAAVVVGGVNIFGGSGSMIGALLGVLLIETLQQSLLRWAGVSEFVKDAILGLLILVAVTADALILGRLREMWVRGRRRDRARAIEARAAAEQGERFVAREIGRRLWGWEGLLLVFLLVVLTFNVVQVSNFLTVSNQVNLFQLGIEKAIVVLAMTFVIISGEIDLSVASMMGLSAAITADLFEAGTPLPLAILVALAAGAGFGLLNGYFVAVVGVSSLAVTLAGYVGFRGLARLLVQDQSVGGFPNWFTDLGQKGFIGPPTLSIVIFAVLAVVATIVLHFSGLGRLTYVVGSSAPVARFSGVSVARTKITIFVVSALVSALAGVLMAARLGAVRASTAEGFELDIITVVLLGGVSIFGGVGTMIGVLLSTYLVLNLRNGLIIAGITGNTQTGIIGLLLILSVLVPNLAGRGRERLRRRGGRQADPRARSAVRFG